MPAGPGDTHLTTLYADVHYYFSDPSVSPVHHRFDRGSYLYLFHNAPERRSKIEIANHAGTPEQDVAFGYLDIVYLTYSYRQPTLCTLSVDTRQPLAPNQWQLPGYDIGNGFKSSHRIESLDVYLWTEKDAATLLGHLKAILPGDRLDIKGAPSAAPSAHRDSMSPVVQQLERTAIGSSVPQRAGSTVSTSSLPGPPTPATSGAAASPPTSPPQSVPYNPAAPAAPEPIMHREKTPPPPDYGSGIGLANVGRYESGQYANVPSAFGPSASQHTPRPGYFPGPPGQQQTPQNAPMTFPGPPGGAPPTELSQSNTQSFSPPAPPPTTVASPLYQQSHLQQSPPSFSPPPAASHPVQTPYQQHSHPSYPSVPTQQAPSQHAANQTQPQQHMSSGPTAVASPGLPPSMTYQQQPPTPSAPPAYAGPGNYGQTPRQHAAQHHQTPPPPPPQLQQHQQQQPQPHRAQQEIFAYSTYNYTNPNTHNPQSYSAGGAYQGDVHSQVYRPTEAEAMHGHGGHGHPQIARPDSASGRVRIEDKVNQVEKRVGGFLKKLDKMW